MTDLSGGAGRDGASLWALSEDTCATKSLYNPEILECSTMIICTWISMNLLISATKCTLSQYIKSNIAQPITSCLPVHDYFTQKDCTHKHCLLLFFQQHFFSVLLKRDASLPT